MSGDEREGFLSRWSRRKREAAEAPEPPVAPPVDPPTDPPADTPVGASAREAGASPETPAAPEQDGGTPAPAARPACPIAQVPEIDPATLPRIEDLTAQSDLGVFLRPGVPQALRNAALRRMWSLDPAIRDYIGPVDYQWDFNTPGGLPFGFSNELGGDVAKLLAQAIGKLTEEEADAPGQPGPAADPAPDPAPEAAPARLDAPPDAPSSVAETHLPPAEPEPAPRAVASDATPAPARRRHGSALPS